MGILIIGLGIGATTYLTQNFPQFLGRAGEETVPAEVKITNISESGFSVSWLTKKKTTSGAVKYGETASLGQTALDDRDQVKGKMGEYSTHHVTLKYLKPGTTYYFEILSAGQTYDNNGEPYKVATGARISTSPPSLDPAYGMVVKLDNTPAEGAILYLTLPGTSSLSTLVKSSGNWLIPLNLARTADLVNYFTSKGEEVEEIFVQGGNEGTALATVSIQNDSPVPNIVLGKNYDFRATALAIPSPSPTFQPSPPPPAVTTPTTAPRVGFGALSTPPEGYSLTLSQPATGAALPGQPVFRGTGIPGKTVTLEINSPATYRGTATVDQNGNWSWTPLENLPPGEHTVIATSTNENGLLQTVTQKFTVLASGSQVTESATPTATPTLVATTSPTPVATISPPPTTANLTLTFLFLTGGVLFVILGIVLLRPVFGQN